MTLYARFAAHLDAALDALEAEGALPPGLDRAAVAVEPPRDPAHGDLATNAAMVLAKRAGTNPRALAEAIVAEARGDSTRSPSAEIAGPGFINLRARPDGLARTSCARSLADGADYGRSTMGAGATVNVEYVSANPTGPMHMGHCRGAVVGDALASLLEYRRPRGDPRILCQRCRRRRSICSPARRTCATARRSARRSARSPKASIRATI